MMRVRRNRLIGLTVALAMLATGQALARPALVIDANTGRIVHAEEAGRRWFPASLTKLMTTYVVLQAVRGGRITLDTPLVYSQRAQGERPSKMGFPVGTVITVDNALKILLVKSANDLAVTLAEGVSGSVEGFAAEMNATAQRLGMTQSHFVNPNGWYDPQQWTSARDMAILARALLRDFPSYRANYGLAGLKLGKRLIRGHNGLIGRFEGADGMKTGFTCPSGYNLVASATRGDRQYIAVLMGYPSARERTEAAAELLDKAFTGFSFFRSGQLVEQVVAEQGDPPPPDMRPEICQRRPASEQSEEEDMPLADAQATERGATMISGLVSSPVRKQLLAERPAAFVPVPVFLGPNKKAPPAPPPAPNQAVAGAAMPLGNGAGPIDLTRQSAFAPVGQEGAVPGPLTAPTPFKTVPMPVPRPSR